MIAGIPTAAEAKADAQAWGLILNSDTGKKAYTLLDYLYAWQKSNPTALFVNIPVAAKFVFPTAALTQVTATYGYIITATSGVAPPTGYTGPIVNWSRVTKVSWQ